MGIGKRIGAGIGAAGAFAGGAVSPLANTENSNYQPVANNDIPAIVQEAPESARPRSLADMANQYRGEGYMVKIPEEFQESQPTMLEDHVEQKDPEPSKAQKVGELGKNVTDLAGVAADAKKGKDKADEAQEAGSALNNQSRIASGRGKDPDQDYSPSNDEDYYNGMGY